MVVVESRSHQLDLPLAMLVAIVLSACAAASQVPAAQPVEIDERSPHQATAAATSERDAGTVRVVRAGASHHDWRARGEHRGSGAALNSGDDETSPFTHCVFQLRGPTADVPCSAAILLHHLDLPPPAAR